MSRGFWGIGDFLDITEIKPRIRQKAIVGWANYYSETAESFPKNSPVLLMPWKTIIY